MIELGRACVHPQHHNLIVLGLLWKGIADYARQRSGRYLFRCSSLPSQDPAVGASAYADLCRKHLASYDTRSASPQPLQQTGCSGVSAFPSVAHGEQGSQAARPTVAHEDSRPETHGGHLTSGRRGLQWRKRHAADARSVRRLQCLRRFRHPRRCDQKLRCGRLED